MVLVLVLLFASTAVALASWKIVDLIRGDNQPPTGKSVPSAAAGEGTGGAGDASAETATEGGAAAADAEAAIMTGESYSQTAPDQRYVTETQRHQNFFIALAEGKVKRMDVIATDYQPATDPNTSLIYCTFTTTDGKKHDGTMVLKCDNGKWRIADIRQLQGELGGGTNYVAPMSFEDDLAREIQELQEFLTKVAQGRLDYMVVDSVSHPSTTETVLTGRVVGVGGRVQPTKMTLKQDYNIWHLTSIAAL
jgi:hypothetical protein